MGFITPALTRLLGFGEYATNMTFNVSMATPPTCAGVRFLLDYGGKKSCLYSRSPTQPRIPHVLPRPSPHIQPEANSFVHPLGPPDFDTKPIPWPCPPGSCPCEDDETPADDSKFITPVQLTEPSAELMDGADCDGISLALISDPDGPGVFLAKHDALLYTGDDSLFSDKESVTIKMEYTPTADMQYMKFYINEVAVTPKIQFTTDELQQGARIFPKITFAAATGECAVKHTISEVWFEMAKVISCAELDEKLTENKEEVFPGTNDLFLFSSRENQNHSSLQMVFHNYFYGASAAIILIAGLVTIKLLKKKELTQYITI